MVRFFHTLLLKNKRTIGQTGALVLFAALAYGQADFLYENPCVASQIKLINTSQPVGNIVSSDWDLDDNGKFDDASGLMVYHIYSSVGTYRVGLRSVSESNDTLIIYKDIDILETPVADFETGPGCSGDLVHFLNKTTITGKDQLINYQWKFGDGLETGLYVNPAHIYNEEGWYTITLTALSVQGCKDTITKQIQVFKSPDVNIQPAGEITLLQGDEVEVRALGDYTGLQWSTGEGTTSIKVSETGIYKVVVHNDSGCDAEDSVKVVVVDRGALRAVDLFTPNNDGVNEVFKVDNIENYGTCELEVYNRWGDKVYSDNDYTGDWTGVTESGKAVPDGAYYFVLRFRDFDVEMDGAVNIVR